MAKQAKAAKPQPVKVEAPAPVEPQQEPQKKASKDEYTVVSPFSDQNDLSVKYNEGDDVSHFDAARLESAIERGLVKKR